MIYYATATVAIAVVLGEMAFRPERVAVDERQSAQATAAGVGAVLEDVSLTAADGARLQAWFANPANANGDAVILLHGIGDNRQGTVSYTHLTLPTTPYV